jgi:hypothetical protein
VTISHIELALRIGPGTPDPAPAALMRALRSVEVTQQDAAPSGFQITFLTEIGGPGEDFALVQDALLKPFSRVLIRVAVNGVATTLIDGFITHQQYMPGNGPDDSRFIVTGEDVSVKMDMLDLSREFPSFADYTTVLEVLAPYALLGVTPDVATTASTLVPLDFVPQQVGTDRCFLQQMAQQNGYLFYVTPSDTLFENTAYWGPPKRGDPPSALLDVAVGPASTVDGLQAEYDALAPTTYFGFAIQRYVPPYFPVPFTTWEGNRDPALATQRTLGISTVLGLEAKHQIWQDSQYSPARAIIKAQAMTTASTDNVATLSCDVSPVRLGAVVTAPSMVGVRGTGQDYDGLYYLKSAKHTINLLHDEQWNYTQSLVMAREGVGTTTQTLEVT